MSRFVSERVQSMVRMTMADMADLADARPGAYRLENADACIPPAEHILEATRAAVGDDPHNSYLPLRGLRPLREAIAARLEADHGLAYDPDGEIVVTSGAGEGMLDALLTLVEPGERVLLTSPTYSGMAQRVRLAGGVQAFLDLVEGDGWHVSPETVAEAARGCKVLFYGSPCMPTGTVFTRDETEAFAAAALENDAVVLFNGSFDKLAYDARELFHPATLPDMRERTVTVGSVSKNYNMMGWRIGWLAGPRELVKPMEDVHIFNGIMPSGHSQAGATAALSGPQDWQQELVATYERWRDLAFEALSAIPGLTAVTAQGGYFFLANVSGLGVGSPEFCRELLDETGVALTPMVAWGRDDFGHDHARVIFTNEPEERLREACELVAEFVQRRHGR